MPVFRKDLPTASRDTEKKREAEVMLEEFRNHEGEWGLLATSEDEDIADKDLHNIASFYRRHFGEEFDVAKRGNEVWCRYNGPAEAEETAS